METGLFCTACSLKIPYQLDAVIGISDGRVSVGEYTFDVTSTARQAISETKKMRVHMTWRKPQLKIPSSVTFFIKLCRL